ASRSLTLAPFVHDIINVALGVAIAAELSLAAGRLIDRAIDIRTHRDGSGTKLSAALRTLARIGKSLVWVLAALMLLANAGINVTSIIASLGIGGIAVALALQNVLGDLFSSVSILVDKPFEQGDFVIVGDDMG